MNFNRHLHLHEHLTRKHPDDAPSVEYVPAGHDTHVAVAAEVEPVGPYFPAAHGEPMQAVTPECSAYVPATHQGDH